MPHIVWRELFHHESPFLRKKGKTILRNNPSLPSYSTKPESQQAAIKHDLLIVKRQFCILLQYFWKWLKWKQKTLGVGMVSGPFSQGSSQQLQVAFSPSWRNWAIVSSAWGVGRKLSCRDRAVFSCVPYSTCSTHRTGSTQSNVPWVKNHPCIQALGKPQARKELQRVVLMTSHIFSRRSEHKKNVWCQLVKMKN